MVMWRAVPRRRITRVLSPAPVSSVLACGDTVSSMNRQSAGLIPKVARPPCTMGGWSATSSSEITTGRARRPGLEGRRGSAAAPRALGGMGGHVVAPHVLVECDDSPRHLPGAQGGEALVDLLETVGATDQLVDLQSALHVEI